MPVRNVDGERIYLSKCQVTFSSLERLLIRVPRLFASPVQQILRSKGRFPLLSERTVLVWAQTQISGGGER